MFPLFTMFKRQSRGGIERKFITSILWVGVIPMALALVSGYVLARENQKNAVRINLETAARLRTEGLQLVIMARCQRTVRAARDPELIRTITLAASSLAQSELLAALQQLKDLAVGGGDDRADFSAYDRFGVLLGSTRAVPPTESHPEWEGELLGTAPIAFDTTGYVLSVATPVKVGGNVQPMGFLVEDQGVRDVLGNLAEQTWPVALEEDEKYEIVAPSGGGNFLTHYMAEIGNDTSQSGTASRPTDPALAQYLREFPREDSATSRR